MQVVLLQNTTFELRILLRADRKCFLLAHCQTIDVQTCVTVPRHVFLY